MERGNLIIYDKSGKVWHQSGEAVGDILPHTFPEGLPYIELPYGFMEGKIINGVDVTITPHQVIFQTVEQPISQQQQIAQLENELLIAKGVI